MAVPMNIHPITATQKPGPVRVVLATHDAAGATSTPSSLQVLRGCGLDWARLLQSVGQCMGKKSASLESAYVRAKMLVFQKFRLEEPVC